MLLRHSHLTDRPSFPLHPKGIHQYGFLSPRRPHLGAMLHQSTPPPTWTWKLRSSPRAGTVLSIPTVPIHCANNAHKAVKWLVSTFHLFKGSLSRSALTVDGKVAPPLVHVYQNNMLLHVGAQMRLHDRLYSTSKPVSGARSFCPSPPTSKTTLCPLPTQHTLCSTKIVALCAEIADLQKKITEVLEHPLPSSPHTILATVLKPPQSRPSSPTLSSLMSIRSGMAHLDHPWLQVVLDHAQCPPFMRSIDSSMSPCFITGGGSMPKDVQQVIQLLSLTRTTLCYIGVDSNGDLQVAKRAPVEIIHSVIAMPRNWHVTTHPDPPLLLIITLRVGPCSLPFSSQCPVLQGWLPPPIQPLLSGNASLGLVHI